MKKCLIFCAAEFDCLTAPIGDGDYILAADGGLRHLEKLNISRSYVSRIEKAALQKLRLLIE